MLLADELQAVSHLCFLFETLPEGVCPLYLPVVITQPDVRYRLQQAHIKVFEWSRFHRQIPWEQFPEAVFLKRHVVGLPIHQDLDIRHIRCISNILKNEA